MQSLRKRWRCVFIHHFFLDKYFLRICIHCWIIVLFSFTSIFLLSFDFPPLLCLFFFLLFNMWLGCWKLNLFTTPWVIKALISLTCEDSPSWVSTSGIPLGFWWGWEGNLPFCCTVFKLMSLEIEYWRLSISEISHFASHPSFYSMYSLYCQFFNWVEHWWISGLLQNLSRLA